MTLSMSDRVAVLVSGSGTNLQALIDEPAIRPHIELVLADRPGIRALERAERAGIATAVVDPAGCADRDAFDRAVLDVLRERGIDVLVSAG
jgi:phosphoribosylglycinamide formyltransferase 1